jgi:signal transduction histidine kinase
VADRGRGIAPGDLDRIFERFDRGSAPQGSGTGLGLTIVRAITEAHGGRVVVDSELGRGTTFSLQLGPVLTGSRAPVGPRSWWRRADGARQVA